MLRVWPIIYKQYGYHCVYANTQLYTSFSFLWSITQWHTYNKYSTNCCWINEWVDEWFTSHFYPRKKPNVLLFCIVIFQNTEERAKMEFPQSTQMRQFNLNNDLIYSKINDNKISKMSLYPNSNFSLQFLKQWNLLLLFLSHFPKPNTDMTLCMRTWHYIIED